MTPYLTEHVDDLPFGTPEKAARYATERYRGAVGRNWWRSDPTLQALMRHHLGEEGLRWADPHLERIGALMGGPVAQRAEETDRNPPRLERYDRWGHDISHVVVPATFERSKRDVVDSSFVNPAVQQEARAAGVDTRPLAAAWSYLLNQAEIAMTCALGTGGDMVVRLAEEYAPADVAARVRELFAAGEMSGEAAQMFTERTGGADLAALETTATPVGDTWRLDGLKWFASNANGSAFVVLAKPEGASDDVKGVAPFLVLWERRDGSRNGVRIRRLKEKLGTKAVASAEVELVDAEAFLLAPAAPGAGASGGDGATGDPPGAAGGGGRPRSTGMARMMEMTNGARLGIAMMGLGCARRALVDALCYARARSAFGAPLAEQPLMQRKLRELVVEVEAAQALVFDGYLGPRLRLGAPLIKLRAARLGISVASDAIEIHGGNGYIEQWGVERILRDAQVNPIWEGPDNVLCLDVRRAMEREEAHEPFLARIDDALAAAPPDADTLRDSVAAAATDLRDAVAHWHRLDRRTGEARLHHLAHFMVDVYAAALLVEQAGWERAETGGDRKEAVARRYVREHLQPAGRLRGVDDGDDELADAAPIVDGAFVDGAFVDGAFVDGDASVP